MTSADEAPEPDRPRLRKTIALIEVLGTSWAFLTAARFLVRYSFAQIGLPFALGFLGWYTLAGYAGVQLFRGRRIGWYLSVCAQLLQLCQVAVGTLAFRFVAGPEVSIYILGGPYRFWLGVTSSVSFVRGSDAGTVLAVNLFALALLVGLAIVPDSGVAPVMPPN